MHRMIRLLYLVLSAPAMILSAGVPFPAEAAEPRRTTVFERAEFLLSDDRLPPGDASAWAPVDLPDQWRYTRPNFSGWGWYRIKFHLAQIPAVAQGFNVSHRRSYNFSVFINGVLIGSALDVISGGGTGFGTPVYLNIPPSMLRAGENTFHIRMHATSSPVVMHGLGRVIFGDGRLVRRGHVAKLELGFYAERAFMIMALVIGVIALFLWFARRSDRVMFWFSVTCLSWALVGVPRHTLRWLDLALLNNVLNIVVRYGLVVPSIILCLRTVGLRSPKIEAGLWAFFLVEIAYPIWSGLGIRVTILVWDLMNAALVLGGIAVIFCLEKGPFRWLHRLEIAALSLMATFLGFEIARYLGWVDVESPVYRQFHVPVMLLALGAAIFDRHVVAIWRMERMNVELEQRVAEKAREIEAYHADREEVLQQRALARERQRIVADMHDGLGASLVGLLRYVQAKQADPHIEQRVKEALQEMRIAIDALEPAEGDLASVLGNLRYRLEPLLEPAGIRLEWNVAELPRIEGLEPTSVFAIQRIVLEAVANALKYSGARRVCLSARVAGDGNIEIRVEDDGRGFDPSQPGTGLGLTNMRARAEKIGARLEIASGPGKGTVVSLSLPSALPRPVEESAPAKPDPRALQGLVPAPGAA